MSDAQQQQFGVMPMSPLGLLQQAKMMTIDYGQEIQDTWLEQQKETAALYGGLSLDGSESGEPGMVELYMSMAYNAAEKQAHATRIQGYTSFAQAGISGFQAFGMAKVATPDSSLVKEQSELPKLKENLGINDGALIAQGEQSGIAAANQNAKNMQQHIENNPFRDNEKAAREDILQNNKFQKFQELTPEEQKNVKASFTDTEQAQASKALDEREDELKTEIERDSQRAQRGHMWVKIGGEGLERLAGGLGKNFEAGIQRTATELQADSQIMKEIATQTEQNQEAAKRQATQAVDSTLQVAGWVLSQPQA